MEPMLAYLDRLRAASTLLHRAAVTRAAVQDLEAWEPRSAAERKAVRSFLRTLRRELARLPYTPAEFRRVHWEEGPSGRCTPTHQTACANCGNPTRLEHHCAAKELWLCAACHARYS